jgi:hypothetical protein
VSVSANGIFGIYLSYPQSARLATGGMGMITSTQNVTGDSSGGTLSCSLHVADTRAVRERYMWRLHWVGAVSVVAAPTAECRITYEYAFNTAGSGTISLSTAAKFVDTGLTERTLDAQEATQQWTSLIIPGPKTDTVTFSTENVNNMIVAFLAMWEQYDLRMGYPTG